MMEALGVKPTKGKPKRKAITNHFEVENALQEEV